MAKEKTTAFVCADCGAHAVKWQGQCPECHSWNSLKPMMREPSAAGQRHHGNWASGADASKITSLDAVERSSAVRLSTRIAEFDRVLGSGLVAGAVVLVGGDPGIGKSTLLLQAQANMAQQQAVLYVTGEESLAQVANRATRLGLPLQGIQALVETRVDRILQHAQISQPAVMVIDSIQTIWSQTVSAAPGSVSQVRESAAQLVRYAKETATAVLLVGHVTKDGAIAGPRVLEHMVDAVLYFEGENGSRFRMLRAFKNRFGAVNELGVFAMTERGLREVSNPSAIFLSGTIKDQPGSCVMVTREGTRPILIEVQALVDGACAAQPRRVTVGLEHNRLAMLLAVLHRHGHVATGDQDVFVNIVGGIRVQETAADLPLLLAVFSSLRDKPLPEKTIVFGEVGLSGEIRPVPNGEERLKEAAMHGFKQAIIPSANGPKSQTLNGLNVIGVKNLADALDAAQ